MNDPKGSKDFAKHFNIPVRVRNESPNTTPPMTPANVASVSALPLRQPFTFSFVNLAMVWPSLVLLASRPHFLLGGKVLDRQHLKEKKTPITDFLISNQEIK